MATRSAVFMMKHKHVLPSSKYLVDNVSKVWDQRSRGVDQRTWHPLSH